MTYKLYKGYILGPGYQNPAYGIYEVDIFRHKEDLASESSWHTSESEWEAELWIDGEVGGTATQADVDELNMTTPELYYMISTSGFDTAAVLAVFWSKLKCTSPTELELPLRDILSEVDMTAERKQQVSAILQQMVASGLLYEYQK